MAKCHLKINVYHSSDYISFLIFVYGVYNLFTNFGNMSQKTKCQNCVKQRNPAETKDSGCQKTHKIHTCPDRYLIGRKKTVDPIDGNLSQYCPNAEIHDHLSFMFHKNHKKHCHTGSCDCQKPHSFIHSVTLLPLHLYESDGKLFRIFVYIFLLRTILVITALLCRKDDSNENKGCHSHTGFQKAAASGRYCPDKIRTRPRLLQF